MVRNPSLVVSRLLVIMLATCARSAPILAAPADGGADKHERAAEVRPDGAAGNLLGKLPAGFVVHAVGTYKGTTALPDLQLDDSGHEAAQADVVVNVPDKPVVLVLTAYDPTVWRIGRTAKTTLAGVIVSGYHAQSLIGINKDTPHAMSTYTGKGDFPYFYAYDASPSLLRMNDAVKALVGKEIERFVNEPARGVFYVGDAPERGEQVIRSDDLQVKQFVEARKQAQPPAGQKALDILVRDGKLRPATAADIQGWVDKASEKYKRVNPTLRIRDHRMRLGRTYVVLEELALPEGLYGAHSRAFIVPDGVAVPTGSAGHNEFYLMDGTSKGPGSRAEEAALTRRAPPR
jgi:hypothetical protein